MLQPLPIATFLSRASLQAYNNADILQGLKKSLTAFPQKTSAKPAAHGQCQSLGGKQGNKFCCLKA